MGRDGWEFIGMLAFGGVMGAIVAVLVVVMFPATDRLVERARGWLEDPDPLGALARVNDRVNR